MRVEVRDVSKRFGRVMALSNVTLVIPQGSRVGLVGPNGSGKSTLLRAIMGLVACDGSVLLDGRSPFERRLDVAQKLAYVPQVAPQFGAPVGEIVRSVEMLRSLDRAAITTAAKTMSLDLKTIWRRPFRHLSGGMKQKLLITLAFSTGASLLILDEPAASLDFRSRESLSHLFGKVAAETTVILCSHRFNDVREQARRIVSLAEGCVVHDGPLADSLEERDLVADDKSQEKPSDASFVVAPYSSSEWGGRHG